MIMNDYFLDLSCEKAHYAINNRIDFLFMWKSKNFC